jgi:acetylornithine/succinyldiaminopimelate/putrescine aminotransferase
VAIKVLEMLERPEIAANVRKVSDFFAAGLEAVRKRHGDIFTGVRQKGLVMGLEIAGVDGAVWASRALYENGVWAIFSSLDKRVLQFKPGILLTPDVCQEILDRLEAALPRARQLIQEAVRKSA